MINSRKLSLFNALRRKLWRNGFTQYIWRISIIQKIFYKLFPERTQNAWFWHILVRFVVRLNQDFAIKFYSRHNHGSESMLKEYFSRIIFYEAIDSKIRRNPSESENFSGITMVGEASMVWSKGLEANLHYYLDSGMSCLARVIEEAERLSPAPVTILDIGCATGNCINILDERLNVNIKKIDGIDISVESIEYAKKRFSASKRCNFYAGDINDWMSKKSNRETPYSIAFSHLVFQFFTQDSLLELFRGIKDKNLCKTLIISDSYCDPSIDLKSTTQSIYNPGEHGLYRFDHNHGALMAEAGYKNVRMVADFRKTTGFVFFEGDCA